MNFSNEDVGKIVDAHRNTISVWLKTYQQGGIDALCKTDYGNRKSQLCEHAQSIIESFQQNPPANAAEAANRIESMTGIRRSITRVKVFLTRHGFGYRKMGHIPAQANAEQQRNWVTQKLQPVLDAAQEGQCHLLFADAAHFILQPFICAVWCLTRLFLKASAGRNRINVLGAANAITKEVITITNTTYITSGTLIDFLKLLKEKYADKPIAIVLDNARYQHCFLVTTFAKSLGIHLLFLPPYSPNLNIIERLWKFSKKEILYAKYYDKPKLFHQAIQNFFEEINQKFKSQLSTLALRLN